LAKPVISLPDFLDARKYTFLGLRVAKKCVDANIRKLLDFPLFLTSANKSDAPECFTREEVEEIFGSSVEILGITSRGQKPSNVFRFIADSLEMEYKRKNYENH
jgi:tRNA A37 threonylcarbamoyladenosine synthetase subunit TsaC/SUA5/YrdC